MKKGPGGPLILDAQLFGRSAIGEEFDNPFRLAATARPGQVRSGHHSQDGNCLLKTEAFYPRLPLSLVIGMVIDL